MNKIHILDLEGLEECKYAIALTQEELNTIVGALEITNDFHIRNTSLLQGQFTDSYILYEKLIKYTK